MFIYLRIRRRTLILTGIVVILSIGLISQRWLASSAVSQLKPIDHIASDQKAMALTINVDWGEEFIPDILNILKEKRAKATFFVTGRWAKSHQDLVKLIAQNGHEIENHGYSHPHPDNLSVQGNQIEIQKTEDIINGILGYKTHFYAPPYGEKGPSGLKAAQQLGYKTILWTLDTVDWRPESTPEKIASRIVNPAVRYGIKPDQRGAIVLMHPKENTVKALPVILNELGKQGFTFITLEELITLEQAGNTTS